MVVVLPHILHRACGECQNGVPLIGADIHSVVKSVFSVNGVVPVAVGGPEGAEHRGHGLQVPQGDLVHSIVGRQLRAVIIGFQQHRSHRRRCRLGLRCLLGCLSLRLLPRQPAVGHPVQPQIVGGELRHVRPAVKEAALLLHPASQGGRGLSAGVLPGPEHLDAELPDVSQHGVLLRQRLTQVGKRRPEISVGADQRQDILPQLVQPLGKDSLSDEHGEEQCQTRQQLDQPDTLPPAALLLFPCAPPLRGRSPPTRRLCGLAVHRCPSLSCLMDTPNLFREKMLYSS